MIFSLGGNIYMVWGRGLAGIYLRTELPLSLPGLATIEIIAFIVTFKETVFQKYIIRGLTMGALKG